MFPKTPRNEVRRLAARGSYDRETIYRIVDEAPLCHVAFVVDGLPVAIPTLHGRSGDRIYLHGAYASRLMKHLQAGGEVCLAFTLLDGLVLARSMLHHSVNYRSAVLFGRGAPVGDPEEKMSALKAISDHLIPGRWEDARRPTPAELASTAVAAVDVESASAKTRSGPPGDDAADVDLPVWAGVLPARLTFGAPQPDSLTNAETPFPDYLANLLR